MNKGNDEAVKIVNALKPVIKQWNDEWNRNSVRSKQMTVKVAPNGSTIGVIDAFSPNVMQIPYSTELSKAQVGDTVWCIWMGNNMQTLCAMWKGTIAHSTEFQVGSVYISSTNTNPSSLFGGSWTLFDKEFTPFANTGVTDGIEINTTNTTSYTLNVKREGHTLLLENRIVTKVALGDTNIIFGTYDTSKLGVSSFGETWRVTAASDNGNGMAYIGISSAGVINMYEVVTKVSGGTIAAGSTLDFMCVYPMHYTLMADSFCNKFYWRRTA